MQPQDEPKLNLEDHPTRGEAQIAYLRGLEVLSKQHGCPQRQIAWLRRLNPAAVLENFVVVLFPNQEEAVQHGESEPFLRLGRCLQDNGLAAGLYAMSLEASPQIPRQPAWEHPTVFMPAFLVSTTLPHRKPAGTEFTRVNGHTETTLNAPARIGLPFGVYPRLILMHLATAAQRSRSRRFPVGRTINELLSQMRICRSGGKTGPSTLARDQLDRLCATSFTTTHKSKYGGSKMDVADRWLEKDRGSLEVALSDRFYAQATEHGVPLDAAIVRKIRRSPLSIDAYSWLTHRMNTIHKPTPITWPKLENQFGSEYSEVRQFRRRFRQAVERVKAAWPALGIEFEERRVVLHPTPPSVKSRIERSNAKGH